MKCQPTSATNSTGKIELLAGSREFLLRSLWIIAGATLLIFLIFFSQGFIKLSETGQRLLTILIYSACIALPSMVLVTKIAIRYTERFPRLVVVMQAACLLVTASFGSLAATLIIGALGLAPHHGLWSRYLDSLLFSIVITLAFGMSVTTYETLRHRLHEAQLEARTRQVEQERANKLLAEARLSSLESSIHPHFLFNTLNSIAALIPSDPHRAEDLVGRLASLLRFSLNAQHNGLVPLSQELKVVRDYLEIEAARFGPRLRYEILVPESLGSISVPAMSLQTLVENSIKHVAAHRTEGVSIQITGQISGSADADRAWLEVSDDGPGFSPDRIEAGHGLGNLRARLELLLGRESKLEIGRERERTVVRLSLPAVS